MVTESGTNGWPSCEVIILLLIWPLLLSEAALAKKMKEGEESWGEHKQPLRLLGRPCFTYENTIFHAANFHLIWKACHASTMPFMRYKKVPHPGKSLQFLSTYPFGTPHCVSINECISHLLIAHIIILNFCILCMHHALGWPICLIFLFWTSERNFEKCRLDTFLGHPLAMHTLYTPQMPLPGASEDVQNSWSECHFQ